MRKLIIILFAIVALMSVSCHRKLLLEPGHHHGEEIFINIDVDAEIDAEKGDDPAMYNDLLSTMRTATIVAYPKSQTAEYRVHKIYGTSGSIWLMKGNYDILVYTSDFYDLDGVYYRGVDVGPFTAEAFTNSALKSKDPAVKSFNMEDPDPLFAKLYEDFSVTGADTVKVALEARSYKYWYEIEVEGLDYITSAQLEIDGMYNTVFLADGSHRPDEFGSQRAKGEVFKDENRVAGEFFSFGPHHDSEVKNSMVISFINGRTITVPLNDMSADIKKLTKGGKIMIKQKLVINVGDDGSTFTPEVEGWEEEEVVIPILPY